ncbi:SurA N-terminal domain-containing protein [Limibaculum sp. M0105]|uniref:Parvulin-like PPIase n=1 Tax=Thermohalobaculum xanthum TaxID=2753746 RepID=A0A8J7M5X4_9RHOB|nr:peptidylprolyl isomerase [Thermohalobaculum xanthum]MBK0398811.1 SurA N-terminal domain-containing protein [Thermohalobaculum xanthum]
MLHLLRRGAKSWIAKLLIALLVLSFAVWGIGDIFSFRGGTAVATAGEEEVTADEFADALARAQARLSQEAGRAVSYSDMRALGIDRRVLASLVRDATLRAELARLGIAAPDRAVADEIRQNPAFLGPAGNFSDTAYRMLLAQQRMSPAEFERLTRALIGQELVTEAVSGTDATAPGLAVRITAWRGETRNLQLLTLDPRLADDPGMPDDAALAAFFEAEAERFREPDRRFGRYLHVDVAKLAEDEAAKLTDDELQAAYESERDLHVTEPTRTVDQIIFPSLAEAEAAAARLALGEVDFDGLAAEMDQAGDGLSLGVLQPGDLPEGPDTAVFALEAPGVTGAVETPLGGAILRVTEVTEGGAVPFEDIRDEIAERLATENAVIRAPEVANEIEELRAAGKTLAEIAAEMGGQVALVEIAGIAPDGTLPGGDRAGGALAVSEALAEVTDALDAEERDIIELPDGGYFLAYVERVEPSHIPELDGIRDRVVEAWRQEQIMASLEERAAQIAAGIARGTGATLATTAAGMGRTASETGFFLRDAPPASLPDALVQPVFEADKGAVLTARLPDGEGVVLAEVIAITQMAPEALEQMSQQIEQALAQSLEADRVEYFARALESTHQVAYYPQAIESTISAISGGAGSGGGL